MPVQFALPQSNVNRLKTSENDCNRHKSAKTVKKSPNRTAKRIEKIVFQNGAFLTAQYCLDITPNEAFGQWIIGVRLFAIGREQRVSRKRVTSTLNAGLPGKITRLLFLCRYQFRF